MRLSELITAEQAKSNSDKSRDFVWLDELETIMYNIKEASDHGLYNIPVRSLHDVNRIKLEKLGYKVQRFPFVGDIIISWDNI